MYFNKQTIEPSLPRSLLSLEGLDYNKILSVMGKMLRADCAFLFIQNNPQSTAKHFKWYPPGVETNIVQTHNLDINLFPWLTNRLKQGNDIVLPDINLLPPDASAEKELLKAQGIKAMIILPLFSLDSILIGIMVFEDIKSSREWLPDEVQALRIMADMVGYYGEHQRVENELRESQQRLASIIDFLPDATFVIDMKGQVISWNRAMEEITGLAASDILGKGNYEYSLPFFGEPRPILIDMVLNPESKPKEDYLWLEKREQTLVGEVFTPCIGPSGAYFFGTASPLYDGQGNTVGAIESLRDVTERRMAQEKIRFLSFNDNLTHLYNRAFFEEEVKRLDNERYLPLSIIIGDVNGLKLVNDAFGHQEGDRLLLRVAHILRDSCRKGDIIARWGGDEFIILLPCTPHQSALNICERIKKGCKESEIDPIQVSIALGTASKEKPQQNIFSIIKKTDEKMYDNKVKESKNTRNAFILSLENTLWTRSDESPEHSNRIKEIAKILGSSVGMSELELENLALLGSLHDIGKITVPPGILNKPSSLSTREWETIKKHSESGYRIALSTPELFSIAESILTHHEHWNGQGYPRGLKGGEIPLPARIIAIIDAYDVMVFGRPYKHPVSKADALDEIKRCSGSQFDPDLAKDFFKLIDQLKHL